MSAFKLWPLPRFLEAAGFFVTFEVGDAAAFAAAAAVFCSCRWGPAFEELDAATAAAFKPPAFDFKASKLDSASKRSCQTWWVLLKAFFNQIVSQDRA